MIREITVQDLANELAAGNSTVLLDVRQPEEHALSALPASILVPLHELPHHLADLKPYQNADMVVYCHHGVRSRRAALFLAQHGFTRVSSLAGGIDAWSLHIDASIPQY